MRKRNRITVFKKMSNGKFEHFTVATLPETANDLKLKFESLGYVVVKH